MKVFLIQPMMRMRPMDTTLKTRMSPSLGLLTVAQSIREGNGIEIINENVGDKIDYDGGADIVGITVTVDTLPAAAAIAAEFRKRGVPVVAGGIQITCAPESAREHFDTLCIGFAEKTWPQIMADLKKGDLKKEYKCIRISPEEILSPAYDMIDKRKYLFVNVVSTSRGCPFKCEFCYNSTANIRNSFVTRPIDDVIADIKTLKRSHIMFIDDNFIGNPGWTREFLERIKPMKIKWNAAVSANVVEIPGMLDLMKESGCQGLFIGFESLNQESIRTARKGQNNIARYEYLIEEIHKRGIMINASFVFGLDDDDPGTFDRTLDWIVKNKIETVTSHILTPYPGTAQHARMTAEGRITTTDQTLYTTSEVVFNPAKMTPQELKEGYLEIYRRIYSFSNIMKRMPRHQRVGYLLFNFLYRKYGKLTEKICSGIGYNRIGFVCENLTFLRPESWGKKKDKKNEKGYARDYQAGQQAGWEI